ncbi:hypothetical protein EYF80_047646 [Liparis tanakae]|uniref:Uncharacterized protein n=1 Tax=Liparis tanakae TaxID=230148 RepID=A0A4Z2FN15_9TELE|nr:hypothetical protein EYF80_047646 [Liparis tanakae]
MSLSRAVTQNNCQPDFSLPSPPPPPAPTTQTHTLGVAGVHLSAWQPGLVRLRPQRLLPWLRLPCPGLCSRGGGRKALGRPWLQAEGGNQISRWERLGRRSHELSAELSLSLLYQSGTKAEPAPEQRGHCPLAGTAAFWRNARFKRPVVTRSSSELFSRFLLFRYSPRAVGIVPNVVNAKCTACRTSDLTTDPLSRPLTRLAKLNSDRLSDRSVALSDTSLQSASLNGSLTYECCVLWDCSANKAGGLSGIDFAHVERETEAEDTCVLETNVITDEQEAETPGLGGRALAPGLHANWSGQISHGRLGVVPSLDAGAAISLRVIQLSGNMVVGGVLDPKQELVSASPHAAHRTHSSCQRPPVTLSRNLSVMFRWHPAHTAL